MKHALTAIVLGAMALPALAQSTPVGLWRNIDDKTGQARAEVRIKADVHGVLSGVIERAIIASPEPLCTACTDDRKDKPKLGLEIIRGAKKAEGKDVWEDGKILDPDNGRNYTLRLTPLEGGARLEVRGSFGPFGRTQTWVRVQ
ncbi:DUF2147 domain-containing protein [Polaromonas sp.]|uniref:DUF2147 domain-containing protein n=1 Tax=Polaromonas sp. TaxID=1869339 RepID=UPI002FC8CFA3